LIRTLKSKDFEEGEIGETYEGTTIPLDGFTVVLKEGDILMSEVA
jgi:hypothetical protein